MFSKILLSNCQRSLSLRKFVGNRRIADRQFSDKPKNPLSGVEEDAKVEDLLKGAATFNESTDQSWSTTPYPKGAPSTPEEEKCKWPKIDPLSKSILLFPGQGTLKVNMVSQYLKFPRVRDLYENANEILGYDLLELSLNGPQEQLDKTEFNQPATVVASLAALERLWEERPSAVEECTGTVGYSVGELTALIFSGAISIEDGIRLAETRGAAMQIASDATPQGMLRVFCSAEAKLSQILKDAETWALDTGDANPHCSIAIYLYPQGKILAGSEGALKYIETKGPSLGLRMIKRLSVSGAFHTKLMEPALQPFQKALRDVELSEPRVNVYSNVSAKPYNSVRDIKKFLPQQIVKPVKWEQIMHAIYERPAGTAFPRSFDLGSGGTIKTLLKRTNARAWDSCYDV